MRQVPDGIYWILDICTLSIAESFRVGPWFCLECNHEQLYLPIGKSPQAIDKILDEREAANPQLRSVGNFIRSEKSLVQRNRRSSRYTEKFRDDLVSRILNGNTTLAQVRSEHNVTDQDVMDWVADMMLRKEQQIEKLESHLTTLAPQRAAPMRRLDAQPARFHQHDAIEGKIQTN